MLHFPLFLEMKNLWISVSPRGRQVFTGCVPVQTNGLARGTGFEAQLAVDSPRSQNPHPHGNLRFKTD